MALGRVPRWATEIVDRMIGPLPMCGHYAFPQPLLQICEAIRNQRAPDFVCGCYTADTHRKRLMAYYVYCLDAWLKRAPLEVATAKLAMRNTLGKNWPRIIAAAYEVLGEPTEQKVLLVGRLVHRLRWWIKTLIWEDDKRDRFLSDVFSGDARGDEANYSAYGNSPYGDPYFAELSLPEMEALTKQIRETVPDGKQLLVHIESTWLCAPKVFRYLEKLIAEIGSVGSEEPPSGNRTFLQCEDDYPDVESYKRWYSAFMDSLVDWLRGNRDARPELGDTTPVKHWLVRILKHKLHLYERHCDFGKLIGTKPSGKRGTKPI